MQKQEIGIGIVEIIVVIAIITGSFFAISQLSSMYVFYASSGIDHDNAVSLAAEGIEATRALRDYSWSLNVATKSIGAVYYITVSDSNWVIATSSPGLINDKFDRTIVFNRVYRDANDDIASSGTEDVSIRKVVSTVSWSDRVGSKSVSLNTYLSDFLGN